MSDPGGREQVHHAHQGQRDVDVLARRPLGRPHVGGDQGVTVWRSTSDPVELDHRADDEGPSLVDDRGRHTVVVGQHGRELAGAQVCEAVAERDRLERGDAHPLAERGVEGADRVPDDRVPLR